MYRGIDEHALGRAAVSDSSNSEQRGARAASARQRSLLPFWQESLPRKDRKTFNRIFADRVRGHRTAGRVPSRRRLLLYCQSCFWQHWYAPLSALEKR